MVLSNIQVLFNIQRSSIQLMEEDDSGFEIHTLEEEEATKVMGLREEAIKRAHVVNQVYALFRKGASAN